MEVLAAGRSQSYISGRDSCKFIADSLLSDLPWQRELVVAGVFVRVFNEQPTFLVTDPPAFCKGLVSYLHMQTQSEQFWAAQMGSQPPPNAGEQCPCHSADRPCCVLLPSSPRKAST